VLDLARLGTDEEDEPGQATDRTYWIDRGSPASVAVADEMLQLINEVTPGMALKYNKQYIGLARDGVVDNYAAFRARKEHLIAEFRIPRSEEVSALINDSGVDVAAYDKRWSRYRLRITDADLSTHRELLLELTRRASGTPAPDDE
jgi:hypothetical protein